MHEFADGRINHRSVDRSRRHLLRSAHPSLRLTQCSDAYVAAMIGKSAVRARLQCTYLRSQSHCALVHLRYARDVVAASIPVTNERTHLIVRRVADLIANAEALLITAGAGMATPPRP